jgi:hypothetical protein
MYSTIQDSAVLDLWINQSCLYYSTSEVTKLLPVTKFRNTIFQRNFVKLTRNFLLRNFEGINCLFGVGKDHLSPGNALVVLQGNLFFYLKQNENFRAVHVHEHTVHNIFLTLQLLASDALKSAGN